MATENFDFYISLPLAEAQSNVEVIFDWLADKSLVVGGALRCEADKPWSTLAKLMSCKV